MILIGTAAAGMALGAGRKKKLNRQLFCGTISVRRTPVYRARKGKTDD